MSFDFSNSWISISIGIGVLLFFIIRINKLNIKKNTNSIDIHNSSIKNSTIQNTRVSDTNND